VGLLTELGLSRQACALEGSRRCWSSRQRVPTASKQAARCGTCELVSVP